ncbi:MAG: NAD(P)H-dependent oxidoreductase [Chitinophagaceae bacterium]|nr:NAD(P)H-dependent oxidoreductase [Chitinophagaceae bacterium]
MVKKKIKILGISGSLRPDSSASAVLGIVSKLFPANVDFKIYTGIGEIPAFDDSKEIPFPVAGFIKQIEEADGVFFCIPEYAFGVPGALKNALDWTVSGTAFSDKPVALITAASQGQKAHAALLNTLTALGTKINEDATLLISFIRSKLDENKEVVDIATLEAIKKLVESFIKSVEICGV